MKIGTHNSMSYLRPKKWYMYLFRFIAKCQQVDIKKQYELGARMFDLRIGYDKNSKLEFRHGRMTFKGNVEEALKFLNTRRTKCYIRLILEIKKDDLSQELLFIKDCRKWESEYKKLVFFCGRRKYDWEIIYKFKTPEPIINQLVSSMTWKKLDDWYPWIYARLMNRKNISEYNSKDWLLIDFINIQ